MEEIEGFVNLYVIDGMKYEAMSIYIICPENMYLGIIQSLCKSLLLTSISEVKFKMSPS